MKTVVYVDAFNLYYGAVKDTPYKWLDIGALCRALETTARFYKHIREPALAASQFPTILTDGLGAFHKPTSW